MPYQLCLHCLKHNVAIIIVCICFEAVCQQLLPKRMLSCRLLCCLNSPKSNHSAYSTYKIVCVPTPTHSSIVLLHGPVSAPSLQPHPLLSQTSHISWRDGDDVRGRGGGRRGDYTHYLSESSSNLTATASISPPLPSTSNT